MTRWDGLFGDLEAQAAALAESERAGEIDDRARAEVGGLRLVDRLRPAVGATVGLHLRGGLLLSGTLARVGADFVVMTEAAGREAVVPLAAVLTVRGLSRWSAAPGSEGFVASRLGLRSALRGLARDRSSLHLHLVDATVLAGTVDRVGADAVELAAHPAGELRRRAAVSEVLVVPVAAIAALRRDA